MSKTVIDSDYHTTNLKTRPNQPVQWYNQRISWVSAKKFLDDQKNFARKTVFVILKLFNIGIFLVLIYYLIFQAAEVLINILF